MDIGKQMRIKRNRKRRNRKYGAKAPRKKMPRWGWIVIVSLVILAVVTGMLLVRQNQKKVEAQQKLKIQLQKDKDKADADKTANKSSEKEDAVVVANEKKAKEIVEQMTIDEKVLGMIITSPEDFTGIKVAVAAGDQSKQVLNQYAIGGLTYQEKNFEDVSQLELMLTNTKAYAKYPMFLCVNERCKKAASSSGETMDQIGFTVDMSDGWKYFDKDGKEVPMETTLKIAECTSENAVELVNAGNDVLVMTEGFEAAYRNIMAAVTDGSIKEETIDASILKIMKLKVR